jgi:hypothetical protein
MGAMREKETSKDFFCSFFPFDFSGLVTVLQAFLIAYPVTSQLSGIGVGFIVLSGV